MTPQNEQQKQAKAALLHYTAAIRAVLQVKGQTPFALAGLTIYEALAQIDHSLQRSLQQQADPLLEEMHQITQHRHAVTDDYQRLRRQQDYVLGLAEILAPPRTEGGIWTQTGAEVAQAVERYLDSLRAMQDLYVEDEAIIEHIIRRTEAWAPGLYVCYDEPQIPRTNNEMEQHIGALKRQRRRITGRKATADYVVRHGPYVMLHDESETVEEILTRFRTVSYETFCQERERFREGHAVQSRIRSFRRDAAGFLERTEALWRAANPP